MDYLHIDFKSHFFKCFLKISFLNQAKIVQYIKGILKKFKKLAR